MQPVLILVFCLLSLSVCRGGYNASMFHEIVAQLERDALELAHQVEHLHHLHQLRCNNNKNNETLVDGGCAHANYHHCLSQLPDPTCEGNNNNAQQQQQQLGQPVVEECGESAMCGSVVDYSVSSVRILQSKATGLNYNPEDEQLIESICFTRKLDDWFKEKRQNDTSYWDTRGTGPLHMYFGSTTGAFRIYPARPSKDCNFYDPRQRPWYLAASSGPKNLVLVLDVSASMKDRIDDLKWATKRTVRTLSSSDYIAIILYHSTANVLGNFTSLMEATEEHKVLLDGLIDEIDYYGLTNFYDAFSLAFDTLDTTLNSSEIHCENTAILFLTDGISNTPIANVTEDVRSLVFRRMETSKALLNNEDILLLTYSVSGVEPNVDVLPRDLACGVERGIWTPISEQVPIYDALPNYHRFFALGLGNESYHNPTWSKYNFSNSNMLGLTVSVPVYDHSRNQNNHLGVVGIDVALQPIIAALFLSIDEGNVMDLFDELIFNSSQTCHLLRFDNCSYDSYRDANAACPSDCSVLPPDSAITCEMEHPKFLWNNTYLADVNYTNRACCRVDKISSMATSQCSNFEPWSAPVVETASPTFVPVYPELSTDVRVDDSSADAWRTLSIVLCSIFGYLVLAMFALDYIRNGCWCGRSRRTPEAVQRRP